MQDMHLVSHVFDPREMSASLVETHVGTREGSDWP